MDREERWRTDISREYGDVRSGKFGTNKLRYLLEHEGEGHALRSTPGTAGAETGHEAVEEGGERGRRLRAGSRSGSGVGCGGSGDGLVEAYGLLGGGRRRLG